MTKQPVKVHDKYSTFLEDQRVFFDELITEEWESYHNPEWDRRRRFEVDCLFRLVKAETVLDVGCGCGFHDLLMAEMPGVKRVVGIDYSEKSIEVANRTYPHAKVSRSVCDIRQLPPSGEYDLVVSFQVIEHLPDAAAFLDLCRAQAKVGGHVAVVTPNRLRLANRLRILAGRPPILGDPQHFREYVPSELRELGKAVGLRHVGGFAYDLTFRLPRFGVSLLPAGVSLRLGHMVAPLADCFCVVFRRDPK